jgi:hypothetical protein
LTLGFLLIAGLSSWSFPKYHIAVLGPIIIIIILFIPKDTIDFKRILPTILFTVFLISLYFIFVLKDPILPEIGSRVLTVKFFDALMPIIQRAFLYAILPIFLCIFLILKIPLNKIWLTLMFLLLFTSIYIDVIQATADYSTHNIYGDRGLKDVIEFMKDKNPSEVLCYIHVGYFLDYQKAYELTGLYYQKEKLIDILQNRNIMWIILYPKDIDLLGPLLDNFKKEKEIGSYILLKRVM